MDVPHSDPSAALVHCADTATKRKQKKKNEFDCCDFSHSAARPSLKMTGERELTGSVVLADRHKWFRSAFSETDRISREQRRTVDESFPYDWRSKHCVQFARDRGDIWKKHY
jgi:hypothetical protein